MSQFRTPMGLERRRYSAEESRRIDRLIQAVEKARRVRRFQEIAKRIKEDYTLKAR